VRVFTKGAPDMLLDGGLTTKALTKSGNIENIND
jgi:hypothetical protein